MALDFPNPPLTVGQTYNAPSGVVYTWDGSVWTAPASGPPSGAAGGDLGAAGSTYPNPVIAPLAVSTGKLAALAVTDAKVNDVGWAKLTGIPAASGDVSGTYPALTVTPAAKSKWVDEPGPQQLRPIGTNYGVALPSGGTGLIIRHSTYPTIDRRTGVDADDIVLQVHAGSSGTQFKNWDSSAVLATLDASGKLTVSTDPTAALDVTTKQYVDLRAVPAGGATGMVLGKTTASDYATAWINPPASFWSDTGSALTPVNAARAVSIPGSGGNPALLSMGNLTGKTRLQASNGTPSLNLGINRDAILLTQDDTTRSSWLLTMPSNTTGFSESMQIRRTPPGGSETVLLYLDNTGALTVPGTGEPLIIGTRTVKGRLTTPTAADAVNLTINRSGGGVADDAAQSAWRLSLRPTSNGDNCAIFRAPAGGAEAALLTLDNLGGLTLPGTAGTNGSPLVSMGSTTWKGYLLSNNSAVVPTLVMSTNRHPATGVVDDTSKSAWQVSLGTSSDFFQLGRVPAGGAYAAMLTLDNAGGLLLTNGARLAGNLAGANPYTDLTANYNQSIIATRPQHLFRMDTNADQITVQRQAPSGGAWTALATFQGGSVPVGDFVINGNNATKATGTTWINPSDPRLKTAAAPYARGLADLGQLEPITYRLKTHPETVCYGFDAAAVRPVFPECVSETRMKLDPADEDETDGVLTFDMHPILVALVNAIQELTARVVALEAHA